VVARLRLSRLDIQTGAEPLQLESLKATSRLIPFKSARVSSPRSATGQDLEISWRTARLDAHETYMDTPYYEQLQYIGDTRVQALISYAVAGDDRLGREALEAFDNSRTPDGITRSRYPAPCRRPSPLFSSWIGMLHDYWMYRPIRNRRVLRCRNPHRPGLVPEYEQPDGLLHEVPWWSFIDW